MARATIDWVLANGRLSAERADGAAGASQVAALVAGAAAMRSRWCGQPSLRRRTCMALRLTSNRSARRPTSSPCSSTASRTRVLRHEQFGRELVGLALLPLPGGVDGAAALGRQALRVQHEVADLVGDGEPAAVLAGRAAQHDRVAVADGLERGLADERLAGGLDDLEVERAHDVTQRDGLA